MLVSWLSWEMFVQQKEQVFGTMLFVTSIALAIAFVVAWRYAVPDAIRDGIGFAAIALFALAWLIVRHALKRYSRKLRFRHYIQRAGRL